MRLFVAITLPDRQRQDLMALTSGLPGVRWVQPENLHLTLRFIGDVDGPQAGDIDAALSGLQCDSFDLQIEGVGHFGEGRNLRALWAGVAPDPVLLRLQAKIEQALQRAGLPPEARKFKPHVTLARFKASPGAKLQDYLSAHAAFRCAPFRAERFTLYSSFLASSGAIHTAEAEYDLLRVTAA